MNLSSRRRLTAAAVLGVALTLPTAVLPAAAAHPLPTANVVAATEDAPRDTATSSVTTLSADVSVAAGSTTRAPRITRQPASIMVRHHQKARFKVRAKGHHLTYRWYQRKLGATHWKPVHGKKGKHKKLVVHASRGRDRAKYRVVVTAGQSTVTSQRAKLKVLARPRFTSQPKPRVVKSGKRFVLSVRATGHRLRYRWEVKSWDGHWKHLKAKHGRRIHVRARTTKSGNKYRVRVHNAVGHRTSRAALLLVRSTRRDPAAAGQPMLLKDWGVDLVASDKTRLGDGTTAVIGGVSACYQGSGSANPWMDLDFTYVGKHGAAYDNDGTYIDGDIWDAGRVYHGGCTSFVVVAIVPNREVHRGVWSVRDTSHYSDVREEFFVGL